MKEYVADFETVKDNPDIIEDDRQRVWLWAIRSVDTDPESDCEIGLTVDSFIEHLSELTEKRCVVFFHNLAFDVSFIIPYLIKEGWTWHGEITNLNQLGNLEYTTNISFLNVVYSVSIRTKAGNLVTFRDSLKLFRGSEKQLAKDYKLPTAKGEIDYTKPRPVGYVPTAKEIEYIKNDVYIIAYILSLFREQGFKKYTTASSALYEFLVTAFPRKDGKVNYQTSLKMFKERHRISPMQDSLIREAYRGGVVLVNPKYKGKEVGAGICCDVNSMFPAQMYNKAMPYGQPFYFSGQPKPNEHFNLYVAHIQVDFKTKDGYFPIIQNKHRMIPYKRAREYLTDTDGNLIDIWITNVDLAILIETSEIFNIKYIEGYYFKSKVGGYFRNYIDRFYKMKNEGKAEKNASKKQFGKLYLNSLYGKFASKLSNHIMEPFIDKYGHLRFKSIGMTDSDPLYIPLAVFITAYARQTLYQAINANRDRFLYCDTDSVHLIGLENPKGIEVDKSKLGAWDIEYTFTRAKYLGSKCYVEDVTDGDLLVRCAGLTTDPINDPRYIPPKDVNLAVTFENFNYGSKFAVKKGRTGIDGKYIDYLTYELKER